MQVQCSLFLLTLCWSPPSRLAAECSVIFTSYCLTLSICCLVYSGFISCFFFFFLLKTAACCGWKQGWKEQRCRPEKPKRLAKRHLKAQHQCLVKIRCGVVLTSDPFNITQSNFTHWSMNKIKTWMFSALVPSGGRVCWYPKDFFVGADMWSWFWSYKTVWSTRVLSQSCIWMCM